MKRYDVKKFGWKPKSFNQALEHTIGDYLGRSLTVKKFEKFKKEHAERIINTLDLKRGLIVLDLGCGIGEDAKHVSKKCKEVHAADISKEMLGYARKRIKAKNVYFYETNGIDLRCFKDDFFDAGYASGLFIHLHVHEIYNYFRELKRVLKPGALFYFEIIDLLDNSAFKRFQKDCINLEYIKNPYGCLKFVDKAIINKLAKKCGLKLEILHRSKEGVLTINLINQRSVREILFQTLKTKMSKR